MALFHNRDLLPPQSLHPSCPSGGNWYTCITGSRFVGCCTGDVNPCHARTICPPENIRPASFDTADYGSFSDQMCGAGSKWYTCAEATPPFMGCCASDPCSSGCPAGNLTAARLSSNEEVASAFLNTTSAASTSSGSATGNITIQADDSPGHHAALLAGGVIGTIAGFCSIIIAIVWFLKRRRQARRKQLKIQLMLNHHNGAYFHGYEASKRKIVDEDDDDSDGSTRIMTPVVDLPGSLTNVRSKENPEGVEGDDRPRLNFSRPRTAGSNSPNQSPDGSPNASRSTTTTSTQHPRFPHDSFTNPTVQPTYGSPSPSTHEQDTHWRNQSRHNSNSSAITPPALLCSPDQISAGEGDYFIEFHTQNHQRAYPRVLTGPSSPSSLCFELDDTQAGFCVELEANEVAVVKGVDGEEGVNGEEGVDGKEGVAVREVHGSDEKDTQKAQEVTAQGENN